MEGGADVEPSMGAKQERLSESRRELSRSIKKGLGWSFFRVFAGRAGNMISSIIIARILLPADYGLFAVGLVALWALLAINDLGVGVAVVRWQGDPDEIAPTVTSIAVTMSVVLYAGCFFGAPAFAAAMHVPGATGLLRVLCLSVLIDGFTAVPAARIGREFRQDIRFAVDMTNFAITTAVTIALALHGFGAWSLVWGRLAGNGSTAGAFIYFAPGRLRFGFNRGKLRELVRFGFPVALTNLLWFGMLNVDTVIIGALLGPIPLGTYVLAFNLSSWPVNVLSTAIQPVAVPGFANLMDDPPALHRAFARSVGLLLAATLPPCVLLSTLSAPAVHFLYGEKWASSALPLSFLMIVGGVRVITTLMYDFLVATGKAATSFALQAIWFSLLIPCLWFGANLDGIRGAALAHALLAIGVVVPLYVAALRRLGVRVGALLAESRLPLIAGAATAGVAELCLRVLPGTLSQLFVGGTLGLAVYLTLTRSLWQTMLAQRWRKLRLSTARG